jgi:hypothetical protein
MLLNPFTLHLPKTAKEAARLVGAIHESPVQMQGDRAIRESPKKMQGDS